MNAQQMESLVDRQLEFYRLRDARGMMQFFSSDIEMFRLSDGQLTDSGAEAVQLKYENFFERSPELKIELLERKVFKNFVFDHERIHGFTGKTEPVEAMAIYQFESDLIRRVWIGI